jgi:hypothetical protein
LTGNAKTTGTPSLIICNEWIIRFNLTQRRKGAKIRLLGGFAALRDKHMNQWSENEILSLRLCVFA